MQTMIESDIIDTAISTLWNAQDIFYKKTTDYGTSSWRIYRTITIADNIYIKVNRINTILDKPQKVNGIGDDIASEFLGIINYALIGIIQNFLLPPEAGDPPLSSGFAKINYSIAFITFLKYFLMQNPHYVEEISRLEIKEIAEDLLVKINRAKNFHKKYGGTEVGKILIFGAFLELIMWSIFGHEKYKATQ